MRWGVTRLQQAPGLQTPGGDSVPFDGMFYVGGFLRGKGTLRHLSLKTRRKYQDCYLYSSQSTIPVFNLQINMHVGSMCSHTRFLMKHFGSGAQLIASAIQALATFCFNHFKWEVISSQAEAMQYDLALSMEFLVPVGTSADIALEHSGAFHVGLLFFTDTKFSQTSVSFFRFFHLHFLVILSLSQTAA